MIHLVLGDVAAGILGDACHRHGLADEVIGIPDDLTHGPLHDGVERIAYMKACFRGYDVWDLDVSDAFAPWRALQQRLGTASGSAITLWCGANVADHVFLRLACWWLRGFEGTISVVDVPACNGVHYVGANTAERLAGLAGHASLLGETKRAGLAAAFDVVRNRPERLRRLEDGHLTFVPDGYYDTCVLRACEDRWLPAARVVGRAMQQCSDGHNRLSDLLLSSRLQQLVRAARVEYDGDGRRLGTYRVRACAAET